ncbi:MAG TPA: hypothetical protein VF665_25760 [Longimicrobium sp.]|jgi:hypothetical protein|uniref:hypothetical protein n=1 Tax=Longimicrobium sp. TaxID=2029185 RepID=UPI002EDBB75F
MNGIRGVRLAAALVLGTALAGCGDLLGTEKKGEPAEPAITFTEPGIYPVLVVAQQTADSARLELHLKRVAVTERVASVQGELKFDATKLALGAVTVGDGITGATNETTAGTLRFAGVATAGIDGGAVLTLSFATRAPVAAEAFELNVEEIIASEDFVNLGSRVRMQGRTPRLTRVPLQ